METTARQAPLLAAVRRVLTAVQASTALRVAVRMRWPILLLLAAAQVAVDANGILADVTLFRQSGELLVSRHWADTFSNASVQVGPGLLLGYGLLSRATAGLGLSFELTLSVLVHVGLLCLVLALVRRACRLLELPSRQLRQLLAGLLLVALDVPGICYLSGHPSEVLIVVLWCHALLDVGEDRPWRAAAWIAAAAAVVTQGAVGLVILLGVRPLRRAVLTAAACALAVVAAYAPFALFGIVHTQDYVWKVAPQSFWGPILGGGHPFPWLARLAQGASMGVLGLLALGCRAPRNITFWVVPAVIILTRLLLDPSSFEYYWAGAQAVYVIGVCTADTRAWRRDWPFYLAGYPILLHGLAPSVYPAAAALVALGWALLRSRPLLAPSADAGHRGTLAKR